MQTKTLEINSYRDLIVWQRSMELVEEIYILTKKLPREEIFGLTSQARRAAVSIPSNIAEGRSRGYRKEYAQFLRNAFGSGAELETQLEIIKRLYKIYSKLFVKPDSLLEETMKMLNSLIFKLSAYKPNVLSPNS